MALGPNQVKDVIATALIKAWEDDSFKEALLASPIETIERLTRERLSFTEDLEKPNLELIPADVYDLVIPSYIDFAYEELSEKELELVTGGGKASYKTKEEFVSFLKSYL